MIPESKQTAVNRALQRAFQVSAFDDIQPLTKGLSGSLVFKIIVKGKPYVLRIICRTESRDNPAQYFDSMQLAATSGIAPAVHYLNIEDKVSITDFIVEQPFPLAQARGMMARLIRRVHTLPRFAHQVDYVGIADQFCKRFQASNTQDNATKDIIQAYNRIADVYPKNDPASIVSSHNDLKRDNILFDGRRAWIVDWEASFLNDRYVDLASMANFVVRTERDENDFLNTYFGQEADDYQKARFFIMSQIVHMFCFTLCMNLIPEDVKRQPVELPSFAAFHDGLWDGQIDLSSAEAKYQYALVHRQRLETNLFSKRFEQTLYTIARGE